MTFLKSVLTSVAVVSSVLVFGSAYAQAGQSNVDIKDARVHSTVPGQMGTGAFMTITAKVGMQLIGVSSPMAGVAEVHEMKMEGDIMKMRAAPVLDLPAGKTVELKPGGYHVMLMDLNQPFVKGSKVPLTLMFKDAKGVQSKLALTLPVTNMAPGVAPGGASVKADPHKH